MDAEDTTDPATMQLKSGRTSTICEETCSVDPYYEPKTLKQSYSIDAVKFDSAKNESRLLVLYTGGTIGMRNLDGGKIAHCNKLEISNPIACTP